MNFDEIISEASKKLEGPENTELSLDQFMKLIRTTTYTQTYSPSVETMYRITTSIIGSKLETNPQEGIRWIPIITNNPDLVAFLMNFSFDLGVRASKEGMI